MTLHAHSPSDILRSAFIEALARRAQVAGGAARALLEQRLAALRAVPAGATDATHATEAAGAQPALLRPTPAEPSPLAALVAHLAQRSGAVPGQTLPGVDGGVDARTELRAIQQFRSTWARLSVEQRLVQSLAAVPAQAGPLNSHHLVHRALTTMRAISPGYLDHFMAHVEALLWLDAARPERPLAAMVKSGRPGRAAPVAQTDRKRPRGRGRTG